MTGFPFLTSPAVLHRPSAFAGGLVGALVCTALLSCRGPTIPADTEQLAPGVWHHSLHLIEGPWAIHVVELDIEQAWAAGVRLQTAKAGSDGGGLAKTSELAINALAAINGDFWFGTPVRSSGMQILRGELLEEPRPRSAFAITRVGEPVLGVFAMRAGLITKSGHVLRVSHLNREPRASDELTYYNRYSWADSVHAPVGFFLQSLDSSATVLNDTVTARVVQVRRRVWPLKLQAHQLLVAGGEDFAQSHTIAPGDTVQLYAMLPPAVEVLLEAIGGGPRIVRDGVPSIEFEPEKLNVDFASERHPRTAIGFSRDKKTVFLVTVDGRQPGHSVGMSLQELAHLMSSQLRLFSKSRDNAHQAINLDGGGSTTMVVRQQVVNRPSNQTGERPVVNALLVVQQKGRA
ncbi:MAG: phosphodiester glycosidase family protein [bacterium]|nr:phosphodiester glycosidase family protein [bacterium]